MKKYEDLVEEKVADNYFLMILAFAPILVFLVIYIFYKYFHEWFSSIFGI